MKPIFAITALALLSASSLCAQDFGGVRPPTDGLWAQAKRGDDDNKGNRGRGKRLGQQEGHPGTQTAPGQQQTPPGQPRFEPRRPENTPPPAANDQQQPGFSPFPRRNRGGEHPVQPGQRHVGEWLRRYGHLPPDQQQRALEQEQEFQQLSPEAQDRLRRRLQQFNALPNDKRERMLERMDAFQHLAPEQRDQLRGYYGRMRQLPDDRRRRINDAFYRLRDLSPSQRERALNSDRFRRDFNDEEREIVRGLLNLIPRGVGAEGNPDDQPFD